MFLCKCKLHFLVVAFLLLYESCQSISVQKIIIKKRYAFQKDLTKCKASLVQLEQTNEELEKSIAELKEYNTELEQSIAELKEYNTELEERNVEFEKSIVGQEKSNDELKKSNHEVLKLYENLNYDVAILCPRVYYRRANLEINNKGHKRKALVLKKKFTESLNHVNHYKDNNKQVVESFDVLKQDIDDYYSNRNLESYACPDGQFELEVSVEVDYNRNIDWSVTNVQSGDEIWQAPMYGYSNQMYTDKKCLNDDGYQFKIYDAPVKYQVKVDGKLNKEGIWGSYALPQRTTICLSDSDCDDNNICTEDLCSNEAKQCRHKLKKFSNSCRSVGTPSVIALRIEAPDASTNISLADLRTSLYETTGYHYSMKSQFEFCSFNKFSPIPYSGVTFTNESIEEGVGEVTLSTNITNQLTSAVESQVMGAATIKYGDLESQFDFVMLFLPPGTKISGSKDWKAYAYINSMISVYNGVWANYPSIHLHEIGHNIGLSHSHDEQSYGDEACLMGTSYYKVDGPRKCFNAAKSWQLHWYDGTTHVINVEDIKDQYYVLVGVTDYRKAFEMYYTVMKFVNSNDGYDYYVNFNAKAGFTIETDDGINKILITRRVSSNSYADSTTIARLDEKDAFSMNIRLDGMPVKIYVHSVNYLSLLYAVIRVGLNTACTTSTQCNDHDSCTVDTCKNWDAYKLGSCTFEPKDCSACGTNVTLSYTTNEHPIDFSMNILNVDTGRQVMKSNALKADTSYNEYKCLQYGNYILSISYISSDVKASNISYKLEFKEITIFQEDTNEFFEVEDVFTLCSSDEGCNDYDGCTKDHCDPNSKTCNNVVLDTDNCTECAHISLKIVPDNYPEETKWEIRNSINKTLILSGNPYPVLSLGHGRKKKSGRKKKNGRSHKATRTTLSRPNRHDYFSTLNEDSNDEENDLEIIEDQICLNKPILYSFIITDAFGDGLCCLEGHGEYTFTSNGIPIKTGGDFVSSEEFQFRFTNCTHNDDCDDKDVSTVDTCHAEAETCIHIPRDCDLYGVLVHILIETDDDPQELTWELRNQNGLLFVNGGPYELARFKHFQDICLVDDTYTFELHDAGGNSLKGNLINYSVYTDEIVLANKTDENSYEGSSITKSFEVIKESAVPSLQPSGLPTAEPSYTPSKSDQPTKTHPPTLTPSQSVNPTFEPSGLPSQLPSFYTMRVSKNSLIDSITNPATRFDLSFELYPDGSNSDGGSILRYTATSHDYGVSYGDRWLLFKFKPKSNMISFRFDDQMKLDSGFDASGLEMNQWNKVKVACIDGNMILLINDVYSGHEGFEFRPALNKVFVYASDEFYPPASAKIRNLVFNPLSKLVNVALQGRAKQSSTIYGGIASRAIDGNINSNFFEGSVSGTLSEANAWWKVDLRGNHAIEKIAILNREDAGSGELSDSIVEISNSIGNVVVTKSIGVALGVYYFEFEFKDVVGKSVKITKSSMGTLFLGEVQVYTTASTDVPSNHPSSAPSTSIKPTISVQPSQASLIPSKSNAPTTSEKPSHVPSQLPSVLEIIPKPNNLIDTIYNVKSEFILSFDLYVFGVTKGWASILWYTATSNNDSWQYPDRWLAFFFDSSTYILYSWFGSASLLTKGIQDNKWNQLRVEAFGDTINLYINNVNVGSVSNRKRPDVPELKVYASDYNHVPAKVKIRRLSFTQVTEQPSLDPSSRPSNAPSLAPSTSTLPSSPPSYKPSRMPSREPSINPTFVHAPSSAPSTSPSALPSLEPSRKTSTKPSSETSTEPTDNPSSMSSTSPSVFPSLGPSENPSIMPTSEPSGEPSNNPSSIPSVSPSVSPSLKPSSNPSSQPSGEPSHNPSSVPSSLPSVFPSPKPSGRPSSNPSFEPSGEPSHNPSSVPSASPSIFASSKTSPTSFPISSPTFLPTESPTSPPTTSPTESPTSPPTSSPTNSPASSPPARQTSSPITPSSTSSPTKDAQDPTTHAPTYPPDENDTEWMVSFTNVTADITADDNAVPTVSIYFDVSKNKLSDMDTALLDKTCNIVSEIADNSLYQMSADYVDESNETGVILIGLNTTAIVVNQDLFVNNTLSFCIRADMTGRSAGYNESITFTEIVVTLNFDMEAGFEIKDASLEGIEAKKVNRTESFKVDACMCTMNGNNATCSAKKLKQNSEFDLCIFSLSDLMKIDSLTSMDMKQNGDIKFSPVVNSSANPFTQVFTKQVYSKQNSKGSWKVHNAARVSSRLVSAFFIDKKLDPVILKGSVQLVFAGATFAGSRKLLDDLKDTEESQFATKVLLDGSIMMKADTINSNTKSDNCSCNSCNMLNVVAIIAACVAVIAFSIVMHLTIKNQFII